MGIRVLLAALTAASCLVSNAWCSAVIKPQPPLPAQDYFITTGVASPKSLTLVKEHVAAIYQQLNFSASFETFPVRRGLVQLNAGKADADLARYSDAFVQEYPNIRLVPAPVAYIDVAVYGRIDSPRPKAALTWSELASSPLVVGALCASSFLAKHLPDKQVSCANDVEGAVLMLDAGRTEWLVLPRLDAHETIASLRQRSKLKGSTFVELGVLVREPLYHYVHERNAALVPQLSKAFGNEKNRAELERQFNKLVETLPLQ